jgi:hypothetical protein
VPAVPAQVPSVETFLVEEEAAGAADEAFVEAACTVEDTGATELEPQLPKPDWPNEVSIDSRYDLYAGIYSHPVPQ